MKKEDDDHLHTVQLFDLYLYFKNICTYVCVYFKLNLGGKKEVYASFQSLPTLASYKMLCALLSYSQYLLNRTLALIVLQIYDVLNLL